MATITLKGEPVHTSGELPPVGTIAPDAELVKSDLTKTFIHSFFGSRIVLNIFPSIDTGICAMSVRKFNARAAGLDNTVVLCISRDLPSALKRFCGAEGINHVITLSDYNKREFGKRYGLEMTDGTMEGLLSRVVIVADTKGHIVYRQLVPEIASEPDYESALASLENLS